MNTFFCPRCGERLAVPNESLGRPVICPRCANSVAFPAQAAEPVDDDSLLEIAEAVQHSPLSDPDLDPLEALAAAKKTHVPLKNRACLYCGFLNVPSATTCSHCHRAMPTRPTG